MTFLIRTDNSTQVHFKKSSLYVALCIIPLSAIAQVDPVFRSPQFIRMLKESKYVRHVARLLVGDPDADFSGTSVPKRCADLLKITDPPNSAYSRLIRVLESSQFRGVVRGLQQSWAKRIEAALQNPGRTGGLVVDLENRGFPESYKVRFTEPEEEFDLESRPNISDDNPDFAKAWERVTELDRQFTPLIEAWDASPFDVEAYTKMLQAFIPYGNAIWITARDSQTQEQSNQAIGFASVWVNQFNGRNHEFLATYFGSFQQGPVEEFDFYLSLVPEGQKPEFRRTYQGFNAVLSRLARLLEK